MSERPEEGGLTNLESELRELRPKPDSIDRAVLMYRAGRASARGWTWPLATAMTTTVAAVLGIVLLIRPAPSIVEHTVYVRAPGPVAESLVAEPPESATSPASEPLTMEPFDPSPLGRHLQMQDAVLRWGLKGIPAPPPAPPLAELPTVEQLLRPL